MHDERGEVFLAFAYIDGPTLADKVRERLLPLDKTLDAAIQMGEGLQAAHEKGIVHRDKEEVAKGPNAPRRGGRAVRPDRDVTARGNRRGDAEMSGEATALRSATDRVCHFTVVQANV